MIEFAMAWLVGLGLLLAGGQAIAAACLSNVAAGVWSAAGSWSACAGGVPGTLDTATIQSGHVISLDVAASPRRVDGISVNSGGTFNLGSAAAAVTLTVGTGGITSVGTGIFRSNPAFAATHTLNTTGNISNAGTFNLAPNATSLANTTFNLTGNQSVSGAGPYTFNRITVNMGATANILDIQSNMTVPANFLTITSGTYKHTNTSNITPWSADPNIPASGGFWLNGAATVTTAGFNVTVNGGLFRISAGTMTIGNANNTLLVLNNAATTLFQMDGGALTVSGGINSSVNTAAGTFTMAGGTITLMNVSAGPVYTFLLGSATTFNMSGGTIVATNGNAAADDVDIRSVTQNITGGTLQLGSAATTSANDISYVNGAGGQLNVWNLVLASGPARNILMRSSTNILNNLTIQTLNNLNPSAGLAINIGAGNTSGNWTNDGTFTQGTTTVTFTGTSAAPAIGGTTATTFNNFTINKASNNLTINTSPTVNATLTFTSGKIVTGANRVILGTAATIATPSATSYVVGAIQKNYNAAAALGYFAGNDFPVGDAGNYTPLDITAGTTTTAGNLTVTATATDHPQVTTPIASTGIDANKSVNRYWRLNNSGLTVGTAISATFTFVAGDIDTFTNTANFIVERYDGTNWNPTTLVAANPLNTQASNITPLAAGNNDFAIGEPLSGVTAVPGRFNAFETSTPASSLLGRIYTKLVGVAFSLDIVSINAAKTAYGGAVANVTVALLDSSNNTGALDVNGCRPTWTVVQTFTTTLNIPAAGRVTLGGMTVPQTYRDARLRISSAGPLIGCSTDRFTIRPQSFTVTSTNAGNTNTTGAPAIKTGASFNLTAASVAGYDGTPTIDNTKVVGTPTAGTIGGSFSAAPVATGTATGAAFFYSEVGNFGLNTNAVRDSGFTSVDQPNDCTADFSNALVGGKYGCSFGSTAVAQSLGVSGFGRFIPDNFAVSLNTAFAAFSAACSGFSYVGQPVTYSTAPVITVTARNGTANGLTNATTTNYAGAVGAAYNKFSNVALTSLNQAPYTTQGGRYSRFDALGGGTTPALDTSLLPATTADPVIGTFISGVGGLTFGSGTGLAFARSATTPSAAFNADIALALNVIDTDGVAFAGNPATFGAASSGNGISFNLGSLVGNKNVRYGIIRFDDIFAPLNGDAPIPLEARYWNGAAFVTNTLDSCTSFTAQNFVLSGHQGGVTTVNMKTPTLALNNNVSSSGLLVSGVGRVTVLKPGPPIATPGSVRVCLDLDAGAGGDTACQAVTPANKSYLQGRWTNSNYDKDPSARASFGVYGSQPKNFIFQRENY